MNGQQTNGVVVVEVQKVIFQQEIAKSLLIHCLGSTLINNSIMKVVFFCIQFSGEYFDS